MPDPVPLEPGHDYHIYNRGTNGETLFREGRNYRHFLRLWAKYVEPIGETYAYCLLTNHFHVLVHIRDQQIGPELNPSRHLSNLFIAYAKAFNKAYGRTGSLFESPFKRKRVDSDRHFGALVVYIHRNPQKHGLVDDFLDWPYSSYGTILSSRATRIQRAAVLDWFGGRAGFVEAHRTPVGEGIQEAVMGDDGL